MSGPGRGPSQVPGQGGTPRYPRNIKTRMTFLAFGLLVLALVWLGLWIWVPANWWNLLLCGLFALAGAALLFEVRRP